MGSFGAPTNHKNSVRENKVIITKFDEIELLKGFHGLVVTIAKLF